jgi:hypothetical protein
MLILGYSCGLQSSLYTKNHHFTLQALIYCPLNLSKVIAKKGASDKSSEDINVGESVLINVAPLHF